MAFESFLASTALPMRLLRSRVSVIERFLETPLTDHDIQSLTIACTRSQVRFGAFYHWYLKKLIISRSVRGLDKHAMSRMLARYDHTDYGVLEDIARQQGGILVAVPHHGHYILSIVSVAQRLCKSREVLIFYGDPSTHSGNEVFDALYEVLWGDANARVQVIHDTRSGMAKAIRGLQNGSAVIIMPDVHKDEHETFLVPFCGRALNVMLGTAALARRTQSIILPMVSRPQGAGIGFANVWGSVLRPNQASQGLACVGTNVADYRITAAMFQFFEEVMDSDIIYWQYVRQHYMREIEFPILMPGSISAIVDLVLACPHANLNLGSIVRL